MPSTELDRNVLDAQFSGSASDWGQIDGQGLVQFRAGAELNRGVNLDLGLEAFANLDASFRKYVAADLTGEARGTLALKCQVQVPMNLFDEVGLAIRLQAVAELAAGASLTLGLSLRDFIALVERDPLMQGVPLRLFRIFMEEVTIGGGLYAKAALSAMAYANVVVAGSAIAPPGGKAGFNILAEAGVGLKAGAGFRVTARCGFDNFRRFIGRTIDVAVDESVKQIADLLPEDQADARRLLDVLRPSAKIALRNAYELGELIAKSNIPADAAGADKVAQRCVQVVLEESQRYLLQHLFNAAAAAFKEFLLTAGISDAEWAQLSVPREKLAERLLAMPEEPFTLTAENTQYWSDLIADAVALGSALDSTLALPNNESWVQPISVIWAAAQLLSAATERVSEAQAAVNIIGLGTRSAHSAFVGNLSAQPPASIKGYINQQLGNPQGQNLTRADLLAFLVEDVVLDTLIAQFPEVEEYLAIFEGSLSMTRREVAQTLLTNIGGLVADASGQISEQATLASLLSALESFLQTRIANDLAPVIRQHVGERGDLRFYVDDVMIPSLQFTTDVAFDMVLRWSEGTVNQTVLKEALSSVLMMLVGRTLVVTTDVLLTSAREQLSTQLYQLADHADDPGGLTDELHRQAPGLDAQEITEIVQDTLRIAGDVFGPLPLATRARIRQVLYEVLEPLPPGEQTDFLASLADSFFIPNGQAVTSLAEELLKLTADDLAEFVSKVLMRVATLLLEELREVIDAIEDQVEEWVRDLEVALQALRQQLQLLIGQIADLVLETQRLFDQALDRYQALLEDMSSSSMRGSVRSKLATSFVDTADAAMRDTWAYQNLVPGWAKAATRQAMVSAVDLALDNAVVDTLLDALGEIALDANALITEVRHFDPNRGVASQLMNLILNYVEDSIRDYFGTNPGMDLKLRVQASTTILGATVSIDVTIDVGRVEISLNTVVSAVRSLVEHLEFMEQGVNGLANDLTQALAAELQLNQKEAQRIGIEDEVAVAEERIQESMPAPRDIEVLEPSAGALYESAVRLRIGFSGVPGSYLGLASGSQQRVFVWLNQELLSLTDFAVEEPSLSGLGIGFAHALPAAGTVQRIGMAPGIVSGTAGRNVAAGAGAGWPLAAAGRGAARSSVGGARARRMGASEGMHEGLPASPSARTSSGVDSPAGLVAHWSSSQVAAKRSARTGPMTSVSRRDGRSSGTAFTSRGSAGVTNISKITVGRKPAANKLSSLWPESPGSGDLQISRTLPISSLQEGVNTLVVAVVDGRGRKVERAVSFIVSAPLVTEREDVEVVLPDRLRPDVRLFGVIRMSEPHVVGRPQAPEGKLLAPPRAQRRQVLERSVARLVPELSANRTKTATSKATDTVNTATQKVPPKHS